MSVQHSVINYEKRPTFKNSVASGFQQLQCALFQTLRMCLYSMNNTTVITTKYCSNPTYIYRKGTNYEVILIWD